MSLMSNTVAVPSTTMSHHNDKSLHNEVLKNDPKNMTTTTITNTAKL